MRREHRDREPRFGRKATKVWLVVDATDLIRKSVTQTSRLKSPKTDLPKDSTLAVLCGIYQNRCKPM